MKKAFTLIELLVVIAIISLLVSILIPSLQKAKELAKSTVCMTNLRSLSLAFHQYASANNGVLPPMNMTANDANYEWYPNLLIAGGYTPDVIGWYYKRDWGSVGTGGSDGVIPEAGVWACPSVEPGLRLYGSGYGISFYHLLPIGGRTNLDQITRSADLLMISDAKMWWPYAGQWMAHIGIDCPICSYNWDESIVNWDWNNPRMLGDRHLDRGNIAFVDGHLEAMTLDEARDNPNNMFAHDENGDGKPDW